MIKYAKPKLAPYGLGRLGQTEPGAPVKCASAFPGRNIRLCMQRTGKPSEPLLNAQGVCRFVRGVRNRDRESFVALHLDTRNRVIGVEEIAKGTLTSVEVHPREVFKGAILNNASSLIFVHNHPSGDPSPSRQDIELTSRLIDVGRLVGIPVRDHVVVGDECHSLRAEEMAHMQWGAAPQKRRRRRKKSR